MNSYKVTYLLNGEEHYDHITERTEKAAQKRVKGIYKDAEITDTELTSTDVSATKGRGWEAACFWPDINKNNEFIFDPDDAWEIKLILATDPKAIFVNGYYTNLGPLEEMTRESLTAAFRWQYEEHFNQLAEAV